MRVLARRWVERISGWWSRSGPGPHLAAWLGEVAPGPARCTPAAISRELAAGRRHGPGGPWMPPWLGRLFTRPGCRAYAVLLASRLRRQGHPAEVVVGASTAGGHAWVECQGTAFCLLAPEGETAADRRARFAVTTVLS